MQIASTSADFLLAHLDLAEPWTNDISPLDVSEMVRVLDDHGVRHVLVGGVAAIFHGYSGATFDADIVPDLDPKNLRALATALVDLEARALFRDCPRPPADLSPTRLS